MINYVPQTVGTPTATFTVSYYDNTVNTTATRAITGTAVNPAILTISDGATYDFSSHLVGTTTTKVFTVTNSGSWAGVLGTVTTAGLGLAAPYTLYVGGAFSTIGGSTRNDIAALDVTSSLATAWDPAGDANVAALSVDSATVYAGGSFANIGGKSRAYLASIDSMTNTTNGTAWNPGPNSSVTAIDAMGRATYASGSFTTVNGKACNYLCAIDPSTGDPL